MRVRDRDDVAGLAAGARWPAGLAVVGAIAVIFAAVFGHVSVSSVGRAS